MVKQFFSRVGVFLSLLLVISLPVKAVSFDNLDDFILSKDPVQIKQALSYLETKLKENPTDGETHWMTAKAYLYLGDYEVDNKLEHYELGQKHADQAVTLAPDSPHSHYWQSALIGRIGQTKGILSSLNMVRPMKDTLDKVLELDENYADAYWVLSQLYHEAPGFPLSIGNKKKSLDNAEKAIELEPTNVEYQYQLAVALNYNGKKSDAVEVLYELFANPGLQNEPDVQKDAEELLAKLEK